MKLRENEEHAYSQSMSGFCVSRKPFIRAIRDWLGFYAEIQIIFGTLWWGQWIWTAIAAGAEKEASSVCRDIENWSAAQRPAVVAAIVPPS